MPVIPNMRRQVPQSAFEGVATSPPVTYVDTPAMDYVAWLFDGQQIGSAPPLAAIPNAANLSVAVVGSGAAGLAAAYELLRCGLAVTLFEAGERIGGRLFASPSSTQDGTLFEMGAMRFTPSEWVLHYYADTFNASGASTITFGTGAFPDPGVNLTYIAFQGTTYIFDPSSSTNTLPASYATCGNGWTAFVDNGFVSHDGSINLVAPSQITIWLTDPAANMTQIQAAWQACLDAFGNASLYEAMIRIFTDANAPSPPTAPAPVLWQQIDFEFFGALGTGFGGFGPLFGIGFLDIMRFLINAVDSDHFELLTGTVSIVEGFYNQQIALPGGGTTTLGAHIVTQMPVAAIAAQPGQAQLTFANGTTGTFDRVVVATSHRSMELTMGLGASVNGLPLAEPVADAVRRIHLENSSKMFVETSAFWDQPSSPGGLNWPRNVVGDTILRNFYTLTYPSAPADTGALLFSYTWADDSVKQQTFTDPNTRLTLLLADLATISPGLATIVGDSVTAGTAQLVDWQNEEYFFGAFKLNLPGQDPYAQRLFYDFLKAGGASDTPVYLAGDSIGFLGGWVENALETGVLAAAGVAVSLGGTLSNAAAGPWNQLDPAFYTYQTEAAPAPRLRTATPTVQVSGLRRAKAPPHP
jgi:tryptophan 2-monooxygenase